MKVTHPNGYAATFFVPADDETGAESVMRDKLSNAETRIEVGSALSDGEIEYLQLTPGQFRQWLGA